jgi:NADH pyrophosphatase NudC (nudix superfamily)
MQKRLFKPKKGQIDYTNARFAPVINCVLRFEGKMLLVKRNQAMKLYPGYWNGIAGFLDDSKTLEKKVEEEILEETSLSKSNILKMTRGAIFEAEDEAYKKVWIIHPVLVDVNTDDVKLDWEAEDFKWVSRREVNQMNVVPSFKQVLDNLFRK